MKSLPRIAIAAPVRAEAPYLIEWLAFHRALGVQEFILGDNGGEDGTSDLIRTLQARGIVRRLDFLGQRHFQRVFLKQAIRAARRCADGVFLIDVDEFVRPTGDQLSLQALASEWGSYPRVGAVALNWAVYGSSGAEEQREGLVIERFSGRAERDFVVNRHTKAFAWVRRCAGPANAHAVQLRGEVLGRSFWRYVDPSGEPVTWDPAAKVPRGLTLRVNWDRARIDHFVLKSRREFERKRARGSVAGEHTERLRLFDGYFTFHDRNEVHDPMPARLVEATRRGIETIERLAGLAPSGSGEASVASASGAV